MSPSFRRRLRLAPLAMLASACGTAAWAVPYTGITSVPDPSYASYLYAYADYPTPSTLEQASRAPETLTLSNSISRPVNGVQTTLSTYASTTTSNDHYGSVTASVHSDNYQASALGLMNVYFTIIGPDADFVPITISGYGSVDANSVYGWAGGYARMQLNYQEKDHQTASSLIEQYDNHESGTFSDVINVQPNLINANANVIILSAYSWVGISTDFSAEGYYGGTGTAFIDPIISIADPALAKLYTIVYGLPDGIVPPVAGAVPEPASWALMVGGFGLVGGSVRRRRRVVATSCA